MSIERAPSRLRRKGGRQWTKPVIEQEEEEEEEEERALQTRTLWLTEIKSDLERA